MLNIENIKKELMIRYNEDKLIPVNINIALCGFNNDEILVTFDTMQYSFIERFKDDISLKDMCEILDKSIYEQDYKYAYYELKKFWNKHKIDKLQFEKVFGDSLFEAKEDEILVSIKNYIFSVSFNDDELSYKVRKIYSVSKIDEKSLSFEEYNNKLLNIPYHDEIEQGVIQLQINRKEAKKDMEEKAQKLMSSIFATCEEIKNNLKIIKGASK